MGAAAWVSSILLQLFVRALGVQGLGCSPASCSPGALLCTAVPALTCLCPQELMSYCAHDVQATHEVFQEQLPLFMER